MEALKLEWEIPKGNDQNTDLRATTTVLAIRTFVSFHINLETGRMSANVPPAEEEMVRNEVAKFGFTLINQ